MTKFVPVAYTIPEACNASGLGKSSIYAAIAKGALRTKKMGSRTLILAADLKAWLENLPDGRNASQQSQ
ncbi:helix-turn-helix domain-containing protein [Hyphomonas adhaerens]|nr:excisionase family DNA-binding protein [Hyphomonas adhaerens]